MVFFSFSCYSVHRGKANELVSKDGFFEYFVYETAYLELMTFIKDCTTLHQLIALLAALFAGENISALKYLLPGKLAMWAETQPTHRALRLARMVTRFVT